MLAVVSLFTGAKEIDPLKLHSDNVDFLFFVISRVPRTLALMLTGAGLSIAGFIMQQVSQNKFVSPTTAGTLDAARLGMLGSIIVFPASSILTKIIFVLIFTFASTLIFMYIVQKIKFKDAVYIPLIGIIFGGVIGAIATFIAYSYEIVQNVTDWLMGDFSAVMQGRYETVFLILPVVILAYFFADKFTIAGLGKSFALNLGLSYATIVNIAMLIASIVVSTTVVSVGVIPFVGLIIPNMVSVYLGDNLRKNLPLSAMVGAIFLLACDIIGRIIIKPYEIPIGMTAGIIGGIVFLVLILKRRK